MAILRELLLATTALCGVALAGPAHAGTVTVSSNGTTIVAADPAATPAINFTAGGANGTASVNSNINVTGTVTTASPGGGTLTLAGGTQTVSGMVGNGNALNIVNAGATGSTTTFSGGINALTTNFLGAGTINLNVSGGTAVDFFSSNGILNLGSGASLNTVGSSGTTSGTLNLLGGLQSVFSVGASGSLDTVNAGANGAISSFAGAFSALHLNVTGTGMVSFNAPGATGATVNFGGDGTVALADGFNLGLSAVTTTTNNTGTLLLYGSSSIANQVGTAAQMLRSIVLGNTGKIDAFNNSVFASSITFNGGGEADFYGNVTGNVDFAGQNGVLILSPGKSISGVVDNSVIGFFGTLTLVGGAQTVSGAVGGTSSLTTINAGANGAVSTFNGNVFAKDLNITGTGQVQLNGVGNNSPAVHFVGNGSLVLADGVNLYTVGGITTAVNGNGALTLLGSSTIDGPVGTSSKALGVITAQGNGAGVTFSSPVIANGLNITGSGTTVALNGAGVNTSFVSFTQDGQLVLGDGASLVGGVSTATSNTGVVTLMGSSTLTGNVGTAAQPLNAINSGANGAVDRFLGNVFATTLNLTGHGTTIFDASTNIFSPVTINSGGILVIGDAVHAGATYSGNIIVNGAGALGGHGTITGNVTNTGTVAPGGSIGTLSINGNYSQSSAGTLAVELDPSQSSRLAVSGTATAAGAVRAVFDPGSYISKQYTILTAANGVSGTFGTLANSNLPAGFKTSLSYDANDVFLNLALSFSVPSGLNQNQQNVANALTNFFNSTGGIPAVYGTLTPAGLTQASGETATGIQQTTVDAMTQFMGVMTDPFIAGRCDAAAASNGSPAGVCSERNPRDAYGMIDKAPAAPSFDQRWSVWAAGYGGSQTTGGNAIVGSNTTTSSLGAVAAGADYRISPNTVGGFALAGGGTSFSVANGGGGRSDLFQAGAFVHRTFGPGYLTAALAYGWQDVTTDRTVTIAGIDQLRARLNANAFSGRAEGGYRFVTPWMGVTLYAAGQFVTFDLPSYAESVVSGANAFALAYVAKTVTASRSEVGLRTDRSFAIQDGVVTLRGRLAWAHDYDTGRGIAATFQALPGASFVVNGAAPAHDAALTTASAEMKWKNDWSALATFEGEFSQVTRSYAGKGVVRYQW